jgi:hypothetical protein
MSASGRVRQLGGALALFGFLLPWLSWDNGSLTPLSAAAGAELLFFAPDTREWVSVLDPGQGRVLLGVLLALFVLSRVSSDDRRRGALAGVLGLVTVAVAARTYLRFARYSAAAVRLGSGGTSRGASGQVPDSH